MLHIKTVEPRTFSILKEILAIPVLQGFWLVGGTAPSLKYGHRTSVDLDIFSHQKFNQKKIIDALSATFGSSFFYESTHPQFGIFCYIDMVKVDIVYYPHPLLHSRKNTME